MCLFDWFWERSEDGVIHTHAVHSTATRIDRMTHSNLPSIKVRGDNYSRGQPRRALWYSSGIPEQEYRRIVGNQEHLWT